MKKIVVTVIVILLVLTLGFGAFLGYATNNGVTHIMTEEQTRENEAEFLKLYSIDDEKLKSTYGYEELKIQSSKNDYEFSVDAYGTDPSKDLFILIHGIGGTGRTMLPYAEIFLERGYDCMMYDQYNSGHHPVLKNQMGVGEKDDLIDLVNDVRAKDPERKIHVFAESYGAQTVLFAYPEIKDKIEMIIFDSPMSDGTYFVDQGTRQAAEENHIPFELLKSLGSMASKVLEGYSFHEVNAIAQIDTIDNPILIISNPQDKVTPHEQALAVEEKAVGKKRMLLSHSEHAEMYLNERETYLDGIDEFLKP